MGTSVFLATQKDFISPSYINLNNPKFLEIDNYFYSGIIITNYFREQTDLILKSIIDTNINLDISIFYEKMEPYKVIRDITYNIGNVSVDLENSNKNRQDIDIVEYTYDDAKYIRKEMQTNNEDFYYIYTYVNVFQENLKELKTSLDKLEGILQGKGIRCRKAYFRQEQAFISGLPLMINHPDVKNATKRNVLTSGLVATYPFISSSICFITSGFMLSFSIIFESRSKIFIAYHLCSSSGIL